MVLKRTLFCIFGLMQSVYMVFGLKKVFILHILYIIVASLNSTFQKPVDFNKAHCSEKHSVLFCRVFVLFLFFLKCQL